MANVNTLKNQLAEQNQVQKRDKNVLDLIKEMTPGIKQALPKHLDADRFTRLAMTVVRLNPKLAACNPYSFLGALMQSAQLGLEPNTPLGQAYLIPYGKEVQFQIGYQGLIQLIWQSGMIKSLDWDKVCKNDKFVFKKGYDATIEHEPSLDEERGEAYAYYAIVETKDGGKASMVMSKKDIEEHAKKYSQSFNSKYSPWQTSFDAMAYKTVLKQLVKKLPKSADRGSYDLQAKLAQDETIKTDIADDMTMIIDVTHEQAMDGANKADENKETE